MTNQQFLDDFYLEFDKVASGKLPGYEPDEISRIATRTLESLILTKYGPKSNRLQEGFEETEKRTEDLGELVDYKNITSFTPGFFDNAVYVTLPNTLLQQTPSYSDVYWYTIYEEVVTNKTNCKTNSPLKGEVVPTTHANLGKALENPFTRPKYENNEVRVLRLRSNGYKHQLITDGTFTITSYKFGYIKKPTPIDLTGSPTAQVSEVSDSLQVELIRETVAQALKDIQSLQQYQVQTQIIKE